MKTNLARNFAAVKERINRAARKAGGNEDEIKLIAVSKTHPVEVLEAAVEANIRVFGENKVQETEEKIAVLKNDLLEWHLIGHLQSNKARRAVQLFDCLHTLDSIKLAERLERLCIEENRRRLSILVQVDLANEPTKNGATEADLPEIIEFLKGCERLQLNGLMTIPPFFEDAEKTRPFFRKLREIRDKVLPSGELSMGMSHDFEMAIEEGATIVRVGTAIFGARENLL